MNGKYQLQSLLQGKGVETLLTRAKVEQQIDKFKENNDDYGDEQKEEVSGAIERFEMSIKEIVRK